MTELSGWLPAAFNDGWAYRDRIETPRLASGFYADRYSHSDQGVWLQRLAAGEVWRNGQQLWADVTLSAGDRLVWHRPPWQEAAVPVLSGPLFDDGDLVVFNKPSGLPVLPAGGFVRHTVLGQLEAQGAAAPRPVHRLGRFTSGLLVCARTAEARAWLSAQLRDSTAATAPAAINAATEASAEPVQPSARHLACVASGCHKLYRALLSLPVPGSPLLALVAAGPDAKPTGDNPSLWIDTPIGRRPHGRLGSIWCAASPRDHQALAASSRVSLLEQRPEGWLVDVAIATGRPHQIRIHAAAAGAPLLGDPLYRAGGLARAEALPGDGGYRLHAHRLQLRRSDDSLLALEAPLPQDLQQQGV